jgi:hypothetical protein
MSEESLTPPPPLLRVAAAAGVLCWAVGSSALPAGLGTLVLAAGLLVTAGLYSAARRRAPGPLTAPARAGLRRLALLGGMLVFGTAVGLGALGWSELSVPACCALVGGCLVPAAELVGRRGCLALAAALMLTGAAGALLALRSAGELYSTGLVGLTAGALLWLSAAVALGMVGPADGSGLVARWSPESGRRTGAGSR